MKKPSKSSTFNQKGTAYNETLKDLTQSSQSMVQWLDALLEEEAQTGSVASYSGSLDEAYNLLKSTLGESPDIIIRRFQLGQGRWPAMIVFDDGQVDNAIVDRDTLMMMELATPQEVSPKALFDAIHYHFLAVGHVKIGTKWADIMPSMLLGMTLLFIDGVANA